MYVAWLGQSCFALAFGGAAQKPLAQNVVRAAASASSYASHDDDAAAAAGSGATASTVAGGGARSDVYSLPSSVSSGLPGTRRPRASCAGSPCRAAIHAYRSTMCEASRIGRTSRMNASCSESGRLSWWSPHANSVSQIGRPNSWCTSSRYGAAASRRRCTSAPPSP